MGLMMVELDEAEVLEPWLYPDSVLLDDDHLGCERACCMFDRWDAREAWSEGPRTRILGTGPSSGEICWVSSKTVVGVSGFWRPKSSSSDSSISGTSAKKWEDIGGDRDDWVCDCLA